MRYPKHRHYIPRPHVPGTGGGGHTNTGAVNEVGRNDALNNHIPSAVFVPSEGNLTLGRNNLPGSRTITTESQDLNANLLLIGKGSVILKPASSPEQFTFSPSGIALDSAALNLQNTGNLNIWGSDVNLGQNAPALVGSANSGNSTIGTKSTENGTAGDVIVLPGRSSGTGRNGKIRVSDGANRNMGLATLSGGVVVVSNNLVTANSRIFLTINTPSGTVGFCYVSARVANTSFTIQSSNVADNSTVAWLILEPQT